MPSCRRAVLGAKRFWTGMNLLFLFFSFFFVLRVEERLVELNLGGQTFSQTFVLLIHGVCKIGIEAL
jgi:hypothetical protein